MRFTFEKSFLALHNLICSEGPVFIVIVVLTYDSIMPTGQNLSLYRAIFSSGIGIMIVTMVAKPSCQ